MTYAIIGASNVAHAWILDFSCVVSFETTAPQSRLGSKIEAFLTPSPLEIWGGMGKMSESIFQVQPITQPLTYFCRRPLGVLELTSKNSNLGAI